MQMQVKIGPDFFAKGLKDYASWRWAWVRELVQNGVDAGSKNIRFSTFDNGETCQAVCENDGPPMDRETLLNKFLCLGGSTKDTGNSIGGFGMAKTVICYAHPSYTIHTGDIFISGSGGEFEMKDGETQHLEGVRTSVILNLTKDVVDREIKRFCRFMQGKNGLRVFLNGEQLGIDLNKNKARRALSFATVHVTKSFDDLMVVRANGVPMFYNFHSSKKGVIVELTKPSTEVLTANRDGLQYKFQNELNGFMQQLVVDKKSALRQQETTIVHYIGEKLGSEVLKGAQASLVNALVGDDFLANLVEPESVESGDDSDFEPVEMSSGGTRTDYRVRSCLVEDFYLRNEVGMSIPPRYRPNDEMSFYSRRLVKKWAFYLLQLHQLFKRSARFSVGFVFSEDAEALYEACSERGVVYYINPVKIVKQRNSNSRSLKNRFSSREDSLLLMTALHEFVHGICEYHDEEYAGKLTEMAAVVFKNRKLFTFRG